MLLESMSTIKETMDSAQVMLSVLAWQVPKLDPESSILEDKNLHNRNKKERKIYRRITD